MHARQVLFGRAAFPPLPLFFMRTVVFITVLISLVPMAWVLPILFFSYTTQEFLGIHEF
jgi:hypothetical protein